jgi:hypothetical protein
VELGLLEGPAETEITRANAGVQVAIAEDLGLIPCSEDVAGIQADTDTIFVVEAVACCSE